MHTRSWLQVCELTIFHTRIRRKILRSRKWYKSSVTFYLCVCCSRYHSYHLKGLATNLFTNRKIRCSRYFLNADETVDIGATDCFRERMIKIMQVVLFYIRRRIYCNGLVGVPCTVLTACYTTSTRFPILIHLTRVIGRCGHDLKCDLSFCHIGDVCKHSHEMKQLYNINIVYARALMDLVSRKRTLQQLKLYSNAHIRHIH